MSADFDEMPLCHTFQSHTVSLKSLKKVQRQGHAPLLVPLTGVGRTKEQGLASSPTTAAVLGLGHLYKRPDAGLHLVVLILSVCGEDREGHFARSSPR